MAEHPRITPEEAARLIKQNGEIELLSEQEIASGLRDHLDEFGPNEIEIDGQIFTVDSETSEEDPRRRGAEHADEVFGFACASGVSDEPEDQEAWFGFVERLFEVVPGLREHFSDLLIGELKEEIVRRDPHGSFATVKLIEGIEADWRNDS